MFSIYQDEIEKPGLSVLPPSDGEIQAIHEQPKEKILACSNCGNTIPDNANPGPCPVCKADQWVNAVL